MIFLFGGLAKAPQGGVVDHIGMFDSIEDAQRVFGVLPRSEFGWGQIACVIDGRLKMLKYFDGFKWRKCN